MDNPHLEGSRIWINDTQGFDGVSEGAWDFWIGDYQPAQKWLKDRALSFEDIQHCQRILKILSETDRIMGAISMKLGAESTGNEGQDE